MEQMKENRNTATMEQFSNRLTISVDEGAQTLGISRPTLYALMRQEGFPCFKVGSRTLISVDGLRQWVADQVQAGVKEC